VHHQLDASAHLVAYRVMGQPDSGHQRECLEPPQGIGG
jgi:hypothetical protein